MRLTSVAPNRNTTLGLVLLLAFVLGSLGFVFAQNPPAQQTPPQQQAPPGVVFGGDAGLILNYIKTDKAADFEAVIARLKEALQKSQAPERKQQAAGWKVFKSPEPAGEGQVLYVFVVDPVVKGADYSVSKILYEVFPTEAQDLYKKYADSYSKGQLRINLNLVSALGQ